MNQAFNKLCYFNDMQWFHPLYSMHHTENLDLGLSGFYRSGHILTYRPAPTTSH